VRFRRAFESKRQADQYEAYVKITGHEPGAEDLTAEIDRLKAELRQVKAELRQVRRHTVDHAPTAAQESLQGYWSCNTWDELWEWRRSVIKVVIGLAQPIPEASDFEERANCPLCGSGGHSPHALGYKLPGGLKLYLEGERARPCHVMEAAWCLARETVGKEESDA